jgi:hypothetical protein
MTTTIDKQRAPQGALQLKAAAAYLGCFSGDKGDASLALAAAQAGPVGPSIAARFLRTLRDVCSYLPRTTLFDKPNKPITGKAGM